MRPNRTITCLLPAFQPKVQELLRVLTARGEHPMVFETVRSEERHAWLVRQGKSKARGLSMHCYGAAVDIIDRKRRWSNPDFFKVLGEEAQKLGLTWGGDWDNNADTKERFYDGPHVQALSVAKQDEFRALKPSDRDAFIAELLGEVSHAERQEADYAPTAAEREALACLPEEERGEA